MKTLIVAAALVAAAPAAAADFDFSYTTLGGPTTTGVIAATDLGGFFVIDHVTGFRGAEAITGYDFFDPSAQSFSYANGAVSDVDFSYSIGGSSYELTWPGSGSMFGTEFTNPFATDGSTTSLLVTSFTLSPVADGVPEPTAWALMIGGIAAAGGTLRRRQARLATA